jgi:hypothetical protein
MEARVTEEFEPSDAFKALSCWLDQCDAAEKAAESLGLRLVAWDWAGIEDPPKIFMFGSSIFIQRGPPEDFRVRAWCAVVSHQARRLGVTDPDELKGAAILAWLRARHRPASFKDEPVHRAREPVQSCA